MSRGRSRSRRRLGAWDDQLADMSPTSQVEATETAVLNVSKRRIKAQRDGSEYELSVTEAIFAKVAQQGLAGDSNAQRLFFEQIDQATARERAHRASRIKFAIQFKLAQGRKIEVAEAAGQSTRSILPHPDDIEVDGATGYRLVGPATVGELLEIEQLVHLREAFVVQHCLERALTRTRKCYRCMPGDSLMLGNLVNLVLPRRFRLDDVDMAFMALAHAAKTRRQLLRDARAAFRRAGFRVKRGTREVEPGIMMEGVQTLLRFAKAVVAVGSDAEERTRAAERADREIAALVRRISERTRGMASAMG